MKACWYAFSRETGLWQVSKEEIKELLSGQNSGPIVHVTEKRRISWGRDMRRSHMLQTKNILQGTLGWNNKHRWESVHKNRIEPITYKQYNKVIYSVTISCLPLISICIACTRPIHMDSSTSYTVIVVGAGISGNKMKFWIVGSNGKCIYLLVWAWNWIVSLMYLLCLLILVMYNLGYRDYGC